MGGKALADVFIIGLLDLEQQTSKVLVSFDDLVKGSIESLQFFVLIIRGLFQSISQLFLQLYGIMGEVALELRLFIA